jgi:hypothetical protein
MLFDLRTLMRHLKGPSRGRVYRQDIEFIFAFPVVTSGLQELLWNVWER